MSDTPFLHRILRAVGARPGIRLFRNNTGMGWVGRIVARRAGRITLEDARPLHAGLVRGGADLIGWTSREITPDMVGQRVAVFTAIEAKEGTGRADAEQRKFLANVKAAGGIAGVVRSEADALKITSQ